MTGASRGIGRAVARSLAAGGFTVAINYRAGLEAATTLLDEIHTAGGEGFLLPFDVSDRVQTLGALTGVLEERGAFWGVVLNAGITRDAPLPSMRGEDWDLVLRTNLDSFYNVLQPLVMPMIRLKSGGRIVTMSSLSGLAGNRGQCNYAASKAGLIAATKSLAREVAKRRITVNCVAPGIIETDMTAGLPKEVLESTPLRRAGTAEEVASLVQYLFSDLAGYITSEVISMHGGML